MEQEPSMIRPYTTQSARVRRIAAELNLGQCERRRSHGQMRTIRYFTAAELETAEAEVERRSRTLSRPPKDLEAKVKAAAQQRVEALEMDEATALAWARAVYTGEPVAQPEPRMSREWMRAVRDEAATRRLP
jgi:hypothetical protein